MNKQRLESLDALRGFDLFFLVALGPAVQSLAKATQAPWLEKCLWAFTHVSWEGLSPWDMIMPLFLFMAGASIPFSLAKYKTGPKKGLLWKLLKRFILLWIFGMICQGNLLALNPQQIYLYSNTLQAIAVGYVGAALIFVFCGKRSQLIWALALPLIFWACMEFLHIGQAGGGDYSPNGNFAEAVDKWVLGRFRDGARVEDGQVVFAPWYHYTWMLSSLNFVVTTLLGVFAGQIAKTGNSPERPFTEKRKLGLFFLVGTVLILIGLLWSLRMPVIKTIWTSSMTLVTGGICFFLLGISYYFIDYKGDNKHIAWLKIYGTNSIAAYMMASLVHFNGIGNGLLFGLKPYLGTFYPLLLTLFDLTVTFLILRQLYKHRIFLKI